MPWQIIASALTPGKGGEGMEFCNYLGVDDCAFGNSARALLYVLLRKLKTIADADRDEVLIPGYTCYSVVASIVKAGLKVRLYDLDPENMHPDMDSLEKSASDRTLAVISQHLFGIPGHINEIHTFCEKKNYIHIEDAAQALGGKAGKEYMGTKGDFGIFSFGRGKPLPLGGGGALISGKGRDLKAFYLKPETKGFKEMVVTVAARIATLPKIYWLPEILPLGLGETDFDLEFKTGDLPELQKRLLDGSIAWLRHLNTHRRKIAEIYSKGLFNYISKMNSAEDKPVYTRFPLFVNNNHVTMELKKYGIRRMYPHALFDERKIKKYVGERNFETVGARALAKSIITLPTNLRITETIAHIIVKEIKKHYKPFQKTDLEQ